MAISCDHERPKLSLPGYTPPRLAWQAPSFLSPNVAEQQRQLLEAFRGIYAELQKVAARRTVVPLQDDVMQLREGQVVTGVAAGQTLILPQPVPNGQIGQVSLLIDAVSTPLTVVHPDGTVDTISEPGLYDYGLGPEGEQAWAKPPGAVGGIRAASAGTQLASTGTLVFSNANNVTFGMAGSRTITASASFPAATSFQLSNSNGLTWGTAGSTVTGSFSTLSFSNLNGVTFGTAGSTLTASVAAIGISSISLSAVTNISAISNATSSTLASNQLVLPLLSAVSSTLISRNNVFYRLSGNTLMAAAVVTFVAGGVQRFAQILEFQNSNGVTWGNSALGESVFVTGSFSTLNYSNSNNVSFGIAGSTLTASASFPAATSFQLSNSNGLTWGTAGSTVTGSFSTLSFSNANNVSFGLAGSTLTASATVASTADPQIGLVSHIGGNSVSSVTRLAFSNASNVTWSVSTAANAATVIASVAAAGGGGITNVNVSAGTTSLNLSAFTLANSNGISFGLSGNSVITASQSTLSFSNANNVSFGIAGSTLTASATVASSQDSVRISAGTTNNLLSNFSLANSNGMAFGINGSTLTASADPVLGLISHVGVNSVSNITRLAFSNGGNISWSLSTAAGAATISANVAAPGILGIAAAGSTLNSVTLNFSNNTDFSGAFQALHSDNNVVFGFSNATALTAKAFFDVRVGDTGATSGDLAATQLFFSNANGLTWGVASTTTVGDGRLVILTGSVNAGAGVAISAGTTSITSGTLRFSNQTNITGAFEAAHSSTNVVFGFVGATNISAKAFHNYFAGDDTGGTSGALIGTAGFFSNANGISFGVASTTVAGGGRAVVITAAGGGTAPSITHWLNVQDLEGVAAFSNLVANNTIMRVQPLLNWRGNMTVSTMDVLCIAGPNPTMTNSWAWTLRGGIYTLNNATRLSLLNSFSTTASSTSINSTNSNARLNVYGGTRWVTVHSSQWSAQPVLSDGVQYWLGLCMSQTGAVASNAIEGYMAMRGSAGGFNGVAGVSNANLLSRGYVPFLGAVATGAPPATVGTANVVSDGGGAGNNAVSRPIVQFRAGIELGT